MAREWNSTSSTTGLLPGVLGSEPATPSPLEMEIVKSQLHIRFSLAPAQEWRNRTVAEHACRKMQILCFTKLK